MPVFIITDTLKNELKKAQGYQEEIRQCQYCKHCKESDDYPPECHYSNIGYFGVHAIPAPVMFSKSANFTTHLAFYETKTPFVHYIKAGESLRDKLKRKQLTI